LAQQAAVHEIVRILGEYDWKNRRLQSVRRSLPRSPRGVVSTSSKVPTAMSDEDLRQPRKTAKRRGQSTKSAKGADDPTTKDRRAYLDAITGVME
ncbi:unnamed protein product, partial [Symbiodinium natans]